MADKPIRVPDIYIGGKRKKPSWEAQELGEINRYWQRPIGTREHQRQMSVKRTSAKSQYQRRSQKGA